jgi:preprotein translocase SecE subunit
MFSPSTGSVITAIVGVALVLGWLRLFTRPGTQRSIVALERAGWFHATSYKSNQGQKVRRATIAGLLILVGAGIYTLISHNVLGRGSPDWKLNIPFTGSVAMESPGDTESFIPEDAKKQVEIRWPGENTGFKKGQIVSFEAYKAEAEKIAKSTGLNADLGSAKDPLNYLVAVNKQILGERINQLLRNNFFSSEAEAKRLELRFEQASWEDMGDVANEFYRAGEAEIRRDKNKELGPAFAVPSGVLVLDRFAVRDMNDKTAEDKNVKVVLKGDSNFTEGQIVSAADFQTEKDKLEELKKQGRDRTLPTEARLARATGPVRYASFTLLPSVQFTVPLLLLAGSLWLAWRVVNMPAFADFLIATEAELNKVSWTTQRKLVQDTIVVLVTVLLMAVFLFGMDWTWKVVLSWKPIGVLHIPKEQSQQNKPSEQRKY